MESKWEPSGEKHGWVEKEASIYSWVDETQHARTKEPQQLCIPIHGVSTERNIKIPTFAKPHLLEYIAMQVEYIDNERLQNDIDRY